MLARTEWRVGGGASSHADQSAYGTRRVGERLITGCGSAKITAVSPGCVDSHCKRFEYRSSYGLSGIMILASIVQPRLPATRGALTRRITFSSGLAA